jgi:excisionase family DNA binding protein
MATGHLNVTDRKDDNVLEPLAVSPRQACFLLGIGNTRLYQLIGTGELTSYCEGRARRITMASIRARIAQLTGAAGDAPATDPPAGLRRGRPHKLPASEAAS